MIINSFSFLLRQAFLSNCKCYQSFSNNFNMSNNNWNEKFALVQGDITELNVDVIVNAANKSLLGGLGVDGAIHNAAGQGLYDECITLGGCKTGEAKITGSYNLKYAKAIIHVVGPKISGQLKETDNVLLADCYRNALNLAAGNNFQTIAFPCISTGVYFFPKDMAATIAIGTIRKWFDSNEKHGIDKVTFCVFDEDNLNIYKRALKL